VGKHYSWCIIYRHYMVTQSCKCPKNNGVSFEWVSCTLFQVHWNDLQENNNVSCNLVSLSATLTLLPCQKCLLECDSFLICVSLCLDVVAVDMHHLWKVFCWSIFMFKSPRHLYDCCKWVLPIKRLGMSVLEGHLGQIANTEGGLRTMASFRGWQDYR
jgi:hypothetical protein